ncbi:MAG: IS3 family transposase [Bacteroidetes bacterium]|nr:IS3 family transposase [Bacteroidota bacterium]
MCGMLGKSKQGYYKVLKGQARQEMNELLVVDLVRKKRQLWKRGSGRNLFTSLRAEFTSHQLSFGRDKFFDILRNNDLLINRKRNRAITTNSYHHYHKYSNLIQHLTPIRANAVWVSDITYIRLKETDEFAYLSLITDQYSRKILGHFLSESLAAEGTIKALKMAIKQSPKEELKDCIHHSDRGIQYCCHAYTKLLNKKKMKISMTQSGDPLENSIAERVNGILKGEFDDNADLTYRTLAEAQKELPKVIDFYNKIRPHRSIENKTPVQAHLCVGELKRTWKNYYKPKNKKTLQLIG